VLIGGSSPAPPASASRAPRALDGQERAPWGAGPV